MEEIDILKGLKEICNAQVDKAKKYVAVPRTGEYWWWGKYDPWFLEPRHIAMRLGMSVSQLEKSILESENVELIEFWKDYKRFKIEVMLHDDKFGQIRPQLAEFALQLFDKTATTMSDVIFKVDSKEQDQLRKENSRLKKLLSYYEKDKK